MDRQQTRRWLVDAMNVIGSRPDGWWKDRRGAVERLVAQLEGWAEETGEPVTVVLESRPAAPLAVDVVEVAWGTRPGPNSADAEIVRLLHRAEGPEGFRVVTSDRALADEARALGATVEPARSFRRRLEGG